MVGLRALMMVCLLLFSIPSVIAGDKTIDVEDGKFIVGGVAFTEKSQAEAALARVQQFQTKDFVNANGQTVYFQKGDNGKFTFINSEGLAQSQAVGSQKPIQGGSVGVRYTLSDKGIDPQGLSAITDNGKVDLPALSQSQQQSLLTTVSKDHAFTTQAGAGVAFIRQEGNRDGATFTRTTTHVTAGAVKTLTQQGTGSIARVTETTVSAGGVQTVRQFHNPPTGSGAPQPSDNDQITLTTGTNQQITVIGDSLFNTVFNGEQGDRNTQELLAAGITSLSTQNVQVQGDTTVIQQGDNTITLSPGLVSHSITENGQTRIVRERFQTAEGDRIATHSSTGGLLGARTDQMIERKTNGQITSINQREVNQQGQITSSRSIQLDTPNQGTFNIDNTVFDFQGINNDGSYQFEFNGVPFTFKGGLSTTLRNAQGNEVDPSSLGISLENLKGLSELVDVFRKNTQGRTSLASTQVRETARDFFEAIGSFSGLSGFSPLFFTDDQLSEWRRNVDQVFASLYLGSEYWESAICQGYVDGTPEGMIFLDTPSGLPKLAAFIEAQRTPLAIDENNDPVFIYRIEASIQNGEFSEDPNALNQLSFNIVLAGDDNVEVFTQRQLLGKGERFKRVGSSSIVQESNKEYTFVCLVFDQVPFGWQVEGNQLCNFVVETQSESSTIDDAVAQGSAGSSSGSSGEIRDF